MKRFFDTISPLWVTATLVVVFVVQNQLFNYWTDINPNPELLLSVIESVCLAILVFGPALLFPRKLQYGYLFVASLFLALMFMVQYTYYAFFGGFMQASALKYAGQAGAEVSTILALLSPKLAVFLFSPILVLLALFNKQTDGAEQVSLRAPRLVLGSGILAVAMFGYGLLFSTNDNAFEKLMKPKQTLHDLNSFAYAPNFVIQKAGIHNYFFGDVIGMMLRKKVVSDDEVLFVQNLFAQKIALASSSMRESRGSETPRNLIVIQVESLEEAVVGAQFEQQEITPRINALRKQGLYFDNYYTQIGPGNTADAEFVTLNSLYPLANTVAFIDFANNSYMALPKLLRQNGYNTFVLHGDVPTFWNRANIYPALGYDNTISKNDFIASEKEFETLSDNDFMRQSAEKMKTFPQPFMATLITLSSHSPYKIPTQFQKLVISEESTLTPMQKDYLQSVHYADSAIGEFIDTLKQEGLYDNSLIVIYGDHGSFTGISGALHPTQNKEFSDMRASRVPLLLIAPNDTRVKARTVHTPASHLDLYPTVATLLGESVPSAGMFGQNVLSAKNPIVVRRDPYLQVITELLTPTLLYKGEVSGVFAEGKCYRLPNYTMLSLEDCRMLYDEQSANLSASDLIVRGNLLPRLSQ